MQAEKKQELELIAAKIRKHALEAIKSANSGHIGGSFSIAEILFYLKDTAHQPLTQRWQ